jgi:hypothetical protein
MADGRYKTVSTFALPDEYQRQAAEARRRRRIAEMLAQQAYQPGDIQNAPIPRGAPLVQGLQAFLAARNARKAEEAETAQEAAASQIGERMAGYLMGGGRMPKTVDDLTEVTPAGRLKPETMADLTEVTPEGAYVKPYPKDPAAALRLGMTPGGMAAMKSNPLLAQRLANLLKEPDAEEFYAPVVDSSGNYVQFGKGGGFKGSKIAAQLKEEAKSELGKMIIERNRMISDNPNDPSIKLYDAKIKDFVSTSGLSLSDVANLNLGLANLNLKAFEIGQNVGTGQSMPVVPATLQDLTNYGGRRRLGGDVRAGQTYLVGEQGPELVKFNQPGTVVPNPATTRSVIQRTSPKERMKLEQQQPTDKKSVLNALGQVSMMKNLVKDLQKHGGVDYIFGPVMSRLPNVRGSATSAQSLYDTLLERTSTETMKQNRQEGFAPGSITVQEWPRFESALAPLKSTKDPVAMRRALENADAQLESIEQRIIDNYQSTYGQEFPLDYSPPFYKFESELYPSPEVKKQKQDIYNRADAILQQMQNRRQ